MEAVLIHCVVGESTLALIRCIRCKGSLDDMTYWFAEVDSPEQRVFLPGESVEPAEQPPDGSVGDGYYSETLEDVRFPFGEFVANRRIDLASIDDAIVATPSAMLELGVFDRKKRANRKHLRSHLLSKRLPARSLFSAGRNTYFASPELVIVQLAAKYEPVKLAQIIMEFTGTYSLAPDSSNSRYETRYGVSQVTTVSRIRAMAQSVPRVPARHKLEIALGMAIEESASPAETILALMFSLPAEEGGYEMGRPTLNPKIKAPEHMREHLTQKDYYPDIYFQDLFADIEYESTAFHLDPITANWQHRELALWRNAMADKAADDRRRMRELQTLGVFVIPATHKDLASVDSLDRLAWALAFHRERLGGGSAELFMEKLDSYQNRIAREALLEVLR